jgi:4-diphosphocytidyl-2-C-methyl-D-erythritol kinase
MSDLGRIFELSLANLGGCVILNIKVNYCAEIRTAHLRGDEGVGSMSERAYAKINLHLEILGVREDGFHELETVMHSVTLFDDVTVFAAPAEKTAVELKVEGAPELASCDSNLASRAAVAFLDRIGACASVAIDLVKRIPIAAGLAGGSSDAAAVLRAMNRIYGEPLSEAELISLGATLGSDVPYCIVGKTALCRGRGELVAPISTEIHKSFVIAIADERVSTPDAFRRVDEEVGSDKQKRSARLLLDSLVEGRDFSPFLYNAFEDAILPICTGAVKIKEMLLSCGASGALMSGSGPSVFGVFENIDEACAAADKLVSSGYRAYSVKSV